MEKFKAYLLLAVLLGVISSLSFAQQNRNSQKPDSEIEVLKKRISVLENQLQTIENVEKMELAAKLADANAKLLDAEIDKFKRELRESNNEWLRAWSGWFLTIIGIFVAILIGVSYVFWFWLRSRADQLIANEVTKSLNSFKKAVKQVDILENHLRTLQKEHASSVLENFMGHYFSDEDSYPKQINVLSERALLDVFGDEMYYLALRCKAAEVLTNRKSTRLVSPMLKFLNSFVDSDFDWEQDFETQYHLRDLISFLCQTRTQEICEGLKKFLNRLLTENPRHKGLVLTWAAFSLADVGGELNDRDSVSILKRVIPFLRVVPHEGQALRDLAEHFYRFNEPESIKEILTSGLTDSMPEIETRCLELLQDHNSKFVEEWKEQKAATNTQNEESS